MNIWKFFPAVLAAGVLSGCCSSRICAPEAESPGVIVRKITSPIKFDGKLDEEVWQSAPAYSLIYNSEVTGWGKKARDRVYADKFEKAWVKVLYDDKYLYVAGFMEDDDIISFAQADQDLLYQNADTMEAFFWPEDGMHYWEIYSTPDGFKTSLFYRSGAMAQQKGKFGSGVLMKGLEVVSQINGSLNVHTDHDKSWTTEIRIPLSELAAQGIEFSPEKRWRFLAARYNYSTRLFKRQVSCFPEQPAHNFHMRNYYSPILFK